MRQLYRQFLVIIYNKTYAIEEFVTNEPEPAVVIEPLEAARVTEELWASQVEQVFLSQRRSAEEEQQCSFHSTASTGCLYVGRLQDCML